MVWFSERVVSADMIFANYCSRLLHLPLTDADDDLLLSGAPLVQSTDAAPGGVAGGDGGASDVKVNRVQIDSVSILEEYFTSNGLVIKLVKFCST